MDLVNGAKRVVVIMEHVNKSGESKIKKECTLPLTGQKVVHRLITDLAVFDFTPSGMVLIETASGVTVADVIEKTEASFTVSPELLEAKI
jgi:3-oxoacid CoA-transferase subunit B